MTKTNNNNNNNVFMYCMYVCIKMSKKDFLKMFLYVLKNTIHTMYQGSRQQKYDVSDKGRLARNKAQSLYNAKIKSIVIQNYGSKCSCKNCPEIKVEFLTIDHINNDGFKHRKKIRGIYSRYLDIIKRKFPKEYQLLCHNCNWAKTALGECPHNKILVVRER